MKARVLSLFMLTAGSLLRAQLPAGANVVAGDVHVTQAANAMTVTQASRNAIVNWQSFNLGAGATFRLQQSGADAAMLARVIGNDPSQLLGLLKADGKFFLINPKGIVVGQGAVIETAAFLASTLDVSEDNFLRGGELTFKSDSAAGVVNYGKITAREGSVFLFAHTVKNAGEINAVKGTVGMGAGTEVLLASPDVVGFVIKTNLPAAAEKTGVENSGVIAAAQAQLEAAGGSIYDLAVNQSGVVRATGSEIRNGRVLLTAAGGTIGVSGEITAQNKNGSGGEILVGGDYRGQNSAVAKATRTVVTSTAKLDASAASDSANAGRVIVWADDATRFLGTLKATGAGGGFAEVSGKRWLDFNPNSVLQLGPGGTLLLDPDALVISAAANSGTGTSGTNPFAFTSTAEPATLNVTTLQNQLAASNVILDTSTSTGDITFDAAVSWANSNALTVRSGNNININADITGGTGSTLALYTGRCASPTNGGESGLPEIRGEGRLASAATINVGTLVYGANALSNPGPDYTTETPAKTGPFFANGNLNVGSLELDLTHGVTSVSTGGANNTIRAFKATGGTDFGAFVVNHHGDLDVTVSASQVEGPYLQFITPGNLTLKSGSSLDFTSAGTVVLASTDGAFVNRAGEGVFGGNARFMVYSGTTSGTTRGGLTGTAVFNRPYADTDDYTGLGSTFFYRALSGSPILTYTADNLFRTYGAANPALTFTATGWQGGVTNDVTGTPALSVAATQNSGVGSYAIGITAGTLASANYDFSFTPGMLTIERAPLTVTANDKTRRINLGNPVFDARFSGFVLGETQAALGGTLSFATTAAQASPAGTYAITPSGLTSSNYAISFLPGTLTLTTTSSLLITANSFNRTYGAANPAFTASYSGFVGGETESVVSGLQFSSLATQSSGVGTYTITPFGATATGYDITYAPGTLTIDRASLTISVPNQSRTYGAANNLAVNYNGLVNGDTSSVVTVLSLATSATPMSNVGTYGITASGAVADNYSILYSQGSLSVTPAPITVTLNHATRRYGDADPAFTFSIGGLQNGDSESLINVGTISSLANATAGIGSYGLIAFPWTTSANYSVPTQVAGSMTITPRPLTITANNFTRVYGDTNPTFTATYDGLASFDTSALFDNLGLTTQATQSSGVGNWGITFPAVGNANYTITRRFGTLTITPAPLTFSPLIELSRLYGRANPSLPTPVVGGLKLADTAENLGLTFETPALNADVGNYTYRLTSTNPNYSLASATGEFRVAPAPITVAITPTGRLYGDANPAGYEFTANGLAFGQTAASVLSIQNPTESGTNVGIYALTPQLNTANYYVSATTGGAFQINPRLLTLDLPYYARYYGDVTRSFNLADVIVGGAGLASFDAIDSLITDLHTATATDEWTDTGYHRIDPTFAANPNYRYSWTPGYLAIMPRPVEVTVKDGVSFGGNNVPADFNATALGVNLILLDLANPFGSGSGFTATISNLPRFATDLAKTPGILYFTTSATNDTQKVGVATDLGQVYFPARPNRTAPQAAGDPLPSDLPFTTISLTTVNPAPPATVDSPVAPLNSGIVFNNGSFVIDTTGTKKDTRFEDVIQYIIPHLSLGGNYVVTKVSNGKLTRKTDPVRMEQTLAAEALVAKRRAAEAEFLNGPGAAGSVSLPGTFGLTRDEYPLIREAFVNMLFDMVRKGGKDPFLLALTGLKSVGDINEVTNDQILFWLADIHTNPGKQAIILPAMVSYGVRIAGLSPAQRSPAQNALVQKMAPFLVDARADFIDKAVTAQQAWGDLQATSGNIQVLTGTQVPYERFMQTAVTQSVAGSFADLNERTAGMSETDLVNLAGFGGGVAGGVASGMSFAAMAAENVASIFPKFGAELALRGAEAGRLAYEAAGGTVDDAGKALQTLDEFDDPVRKATQKAAQKAGEYADDAFKAFNQASKASSTATGVFAIISVAVTILIDKSVNVAEEQHQKAQFDTLLASRNAPLDVNTIGDDLQGRAIMTVGLFKMFGGGN